MILFLKDYVHIIKHHFYIYRKKLQQYHPISITLTNLALSGLYCSYFTTADT